MQHVGHFVYPVNLFKRLNVERNRVEEALAVELAFESCLLNASQPIRLPVLFRNKAIAVLLELRSGDGS